MLLGKNLLLLTECDTKLYTKILEIDNKYFNQYTSRSLFYHLLILILKNLITFLLKNLDNYIYNTSVNFNRKFKNLTIESDKAGSNPIKVH